MTKLAFIVPINKEGVLEQNFLRSKIVREGKYPIILQRGFRNIGMAYNNGLSKTDSEIAVCLHQDVFLPDSWEEQALESLAGVEKLGWGALGVAGIKRSGRQNALIGYVLDRGQEIGSADGLPARVDTLDELLLIIRNDGQLRFDEQIPSAQHFFGADICLQAAEKGMACFAIEAYCHHNSTDGNAGTLAFKMSARYMQEKWKRRLPFATTSATVEPRSLENLRRAVKALGLQPVVSKIRRLSAAKPRRTG